MNVSAAALVFVTAAFASQDIHTFERARPGPVGPANDSLPLRRAVADRCHVLEHVFRCPLPQRARTRELPVDIRTRYARPLEIASDVLLRHPGRVSEDVRDRCPDRRHGASGNELFDARADETEPLAFRPECAGHEPCIAWVTFRIGIVGLHGRSSVSGLRGPRFAPTVTRGCQPG